METWPRHDDQVVKCLELISGLSGLMGPFVQSLRWLYSLACGDDTLSAQPHEIWNTTKVIASGNCMSGAAALV